MNNNVVKFSFVLMITAGLAIAGVAVVFGISKPKIDAKKEKSQAQVIALAFNVTQQEFGDYTSEELSEAGGSWKVTDSSGNIVGYAAKGVSSKGYGGNIEVIAAFEPDLETLIGAAIMDVSKETPGLGQNAKQKKPTTTWLQDIFGIQEVEPQKGKPLDSYTFMQQFQSREGAKLRVVDLDSKIDSMAGATITSKAVIDAVKNARKKLRSQVGEQAGTAASP